ncbi:AAA domain-containing protein [Paenibacillus hunanensis]|uniref:Superfamily I DNA and/or RNA helicase n=1 Tax=Paenibacillus hunanensis TaxID=539262 RepID=A0ABU1J088_9BACL|nr:AAA domain-containing protein [Paenibacillus hunanensis]MDR6244923.1 superfamily I DNA and/or RNA helicase [Paenibacillus hunanensis]GGJ05148.1 DNA helicase [Paenibacillus hunanensis]
MDPKNYIVMLKNEDKTQEVKTIRKESNQTYVVEFCKGDTLYHYKITDVQIYKQPTEIRMAEDELLFHNNIPINHVVCIMDFKEVVRVFYENQKSIVCKKQDIQILKNAANNNRIQQVMKYWTEISKYIKTGDQQNEQDDFLTKEFAKLQFINPNSILNDHIKTNPSKLSAIPQQLKFSNDLIFPFSYNLSQKQAVRYALTSKISVIEGPPGTGKTQTILNILANLVSMNKTVAVVASNNAAVKNVREKMERAGYSFLIANLGNKDMKKKFFLNMPAVEIKGWECKESVQELRTKIKQLNEQIDQFLEWERELAKYKQELSAFQLEQDHFDLYYNQQNVQPLQRLTLYRRTSKRALEFMKDSYLAAERNKSDKFLYKFKLFFKHGFTHFDELKQREIDIVLEAQREFYISKISEIQKNIRKLEAKLKAHSHQELRTQHQEYSTRLFRHTLYKKYKTMPKVNFRLRNYTDNDMFTSFIERYPIMLSTTHSLRNCIPTNYLFDYCIVDESSQVELLTGAMTLSCCKQAIIVGDTKQLPHIVDQKIEDKLAPETKLGTESPYHYFNHNLLSSVLSVYGEDLSKTMLREHYRCHPRIIEFCNRKYYKGDLVIFTSAVDKDEPLMLYKTAKGNHMRELTLVNNSGKYNQRELDVIEKEILSGIQNGTITHEGIGFATPYRKQLEKANQQFNTIENDTIHKYQGREKQIMILSTVLDRTRQSGYSMKFVNNPNMINVAVSRAQQRFILVTDDSAFHRYGNEVGDLMRYMEYNTLGKSIIESELISIFDLLYTEYSNTLIAFRDKLHLFNRSKYKSENIMYAKLAEMLNEQKYNSFKLVNQVSMRELIRDYHDLKLTAEEKKYARKSSVDFVIYHKMDNQPVLAIEVDGFNYHENNEVQKARDTKKDHILMERGLPLLRFPTNGSGEEEKIRKALNEIMSIDTNN